MSPDSPFTNEQQRKLIRLAEGIYDGIQLLSEELNALVLALIKKGLVTDEEINAAKAEMAAAWQVERVLNPQAEKIQELLRRLREWSLGHEDGI